MADRKPPFRDAADVIIDKIRDRKTAEPIGLDTQYIMYIHTYMQCFTYITPVSTHINQFAFSFTISTQ